MVGTWMQQMAMSWLIYRLTNSAAMLGVIGFASQVPSLFLMPFAGIVADRVNRHRLVIIIQILFMLQAGLLAALVFTGQAQLWQLVALSAILGIITAFDIPTRQTFIFDMLENKAQLPSAIAINSSITTVTRLIGPFIAGLLIAWTGEGMCFLVNALSYVAVVIALLFVKSKQAEVKAQKHDTLRQLKEGFAYAFGVPPIRAIITLLGLIGLFSIPFIVLMPAFARDIFHGNASTLGFLTASFGFGSVLGAFIVGSRKNVHQHGDWIFAGCSLFGLGLIAFGFSKSFILSLLVLPVMGFGSMVMMAGSMTLIQTMVDEDKRGRVMSIVVMALMGLSPFGCMVAGFLATKIGSGNTVIVSGIFTVVIALALASRVGKLHREAILKSTDNKLPEHISSLAP
jgi:MFS family permease